MKKSTMMKILGHSYAVIAGGNAAAGAYGIYYLSKYWPYRYKAVKIFDLVLGGVCVLATTGLLMYGSYELQDKAADEWCKENQMETHEIDWDPSKEGEED